MKYCINNVGVFTRKEFEKFLVDYIIKNKLNLRNVLSCYTIEQNVSHHPFRIAKEIFNDDVIIIKGFV